MIMKIKCYGLFLTLLAVVVFCSCHNDDDDLRLSDVPNAVTNTLEVKYPGFNRVEWEKKYGYFVAEFYKESIEMHVWINPDGTWLMTESDLRRMMGNLPEVILNAFQNGQYADWQIENIDKYERTDLTFYLLEVEKKGQKERKLFYGEDGRLLKDIVDNDNDVVTPDTVL